MCFQARQGISAHCIPVINKNMLFFQNIINDRHAKQTVQTQLKLLLQEQFDLGLHCLPFNQCVLDAFTLVMRLLFYFFLFGFYGPFKNISLISSTSFIKCG